MRIIDECLLRDALRGLSPGCADPPELDPMLTEAEFLVDTLISHDLVDPAAIMVITRHFRQLTHRDYGGEQRPTEGRLTTRLVYAEMRERAASGLPLSDGASAMDLDEAGAFRWASFEEWRAGSWMPRVLAKAEGIRSNESSDAAKDFGLASSKRAGGGQRGKRGALPVSVHLCR